MGAGGRRSGVVIEANSRPYSQYERAKLSSLAAQPVEVHCACPTEPALQRYNARASGPGRVLGRCTIVRSGACSWSRLVRGQRFPGCALARGRWWLIRAPWLIRCTMIP
jgi:hypothetical protein